MLPQNSLPIAAEIMQPAADEVRACGLGPSADKCPSISPELTSASQKMTVKEEEMAHRKEASIAPDDDEDIQFDSCLNASSTDQTEQLVVPATPTPSCHADRGKTRGRRRSRWKLKFHHQALPPEYLDHYEASIAHLEATKSAAAAAAAATAQPKPRAAAPATQNRNKMKYGSTNIKVEPVDTLLDAASRMKSLNNSLLEQLCMPISNDSDLILNRLQDLKMPDDVAVGEKHLGAKLACDKFLQGKGLLGSLLADKEANGASLEDLKKRSSVITPLSPSTGKSSTVANLQGSKVVNYQDLPYMGEITLDNMKPRRGRKPKKADICHLIYKNYGTIFQGGPKVQEKEPQSSLSNAAKVKSENVLMSSLRCKAIDSLKQNAHINHTDVQNRIISSLLEKRLTAASQDSRKNALGSYVAAKNAEAAASPNAKRPLMSEEPLNLCVKDLNQLKIRLLRKHGNFYEPTTNDTMVKSEYGDTRERDLEIDERPDSSLGCTIGDDLSTIVNHEGLLKMPFPNNQPIGVDSASGNPSLPGGYVYWPNAGVFVHPMALQSQLLYYQKMGSIPLVPGSPVDQNRSAPTGPCHSSSSISHSPSPTPSATKTSKSGGSPNKTLVPKAFSMMMDPGSKTSVMPSELSFPRMKRLAPSGNLPTMGSPAKRKRSAIFIPPLPSENNANPTTEVSICKFKFTGGAKPSLQEKKMLSVDSGGNFRYYSGTGDKSMRGYEFFPRESLQQTGNNVGSSSEQFLTASAMGNGEKISIQSPSPMETITKSQSPKDLFGPGEGSSHFLDRQPNHSRPESETSLVPGPFANDHYGVQEEGRGAQFCMRRKRKTRKSLAREKLEQTFKEKGFLIQTQQLESAEGATYCKFRQLRKFTRYLFRSWKDYLPGNVREMSVAAGVGGPPPDSEQEGEQSSSNPSTPHTLASADDPHLNPMYTP